MREWNSWLKGLVSKFRKIENTSFEGKEIERFFEIELCLRLHERLIPDQSCFEVWSLLTGYPVQPIQGTTLARRMCAIARHRVRYLRTATAWHRWLAWYVEQPADLRLYEVVLETGGCKRRATTGIAPERLEIYDKALEEPAEHRQRSATWATAGEYRFTIKGEAYSVRLPAELTQLPHPDIPEEPPPLREREPMKISLGDLERIAEILEQKDPQGNWVERARLLNLDLIEADQLITHAPQFTIDGLFHLVGMVGAGKSTLIQLIVYHLVVERGMHITLMLNTVVESIRMAADLRRIGVAAAPALGTSRGIHRLKYGQANTDRLLPDDLFLPDTNNNPALQWLTAPCALSGALVEGGPIPSGYEPCNSLYDPQGKRYACPVRPTCPVHQASQDLVESRVWIVNPASFIHSRAPEGLSQADMRLLEAIYRTSDLLMIDEADRVQVQWDRKYAPVDDLAGHEDALLDWLNVTLARQFAQHGRRQLIHARNNELGMLANEAGRLSNWIMHLLFNYPDLVDWIGRRPLTNPLIYSQLADELACPVPGEPIEDAVHDLLLTDFKTFYNHPTSLDEGGELAELVNDVRHEESGLAQKLESWLQARLPWSLKDHPNAHELIRRLEFSLLLTAMDKRVDDLLRNWLWAAPEFGEQRVLDQSPPDEYVDLLPESPLGNLLGYQYTERHPGGVLKYIQCHGIGRWLLMNFQHIYADLDGIHGPHIFLTSATSWAPGSPQFHLSVPPNAILSPPEQEREAITKSVFGFTPVPDKDGKLIRVSGIWGKDRQENLGRLVRYLASSSDGRPSRLDQELQYWRDQDTPRKVLLVVGSYAEAHRTINTLLEIPGWRQRAVSMHPDDDESLDSCLIRRGEIESLFNHQADVLIAPLLAIQRGFNILDDAGGALLGSVFFLVRPFPVPNDLGQHVVGVNDWAIRLLAQNGNHLPDHFGTRGAEAMGELRRQAYAHWHHRLNIGQYGVEGLREDLYRELLWDQFVVVWQTIGRLVRRGRPARVFFVDAAFCPSEKGRSMLRGWVEILDEYIGPQSNRTTIERQLAETLYSPAYQALRSLVNQNGG